MEGKITKLLVSTGIVMAAAVSMIPLTSYAAVVPNVAGHGIYNCKPSGDNPCASSSDPDSAYTYTDEEGNIKTLPSEQQVSVKVANVLSLDAANGGDTIHAYPDFLKKGSFNVEVRSAVPYTISLYADTAQNQSTSLVNVEDDGFSIPAKSGALTPGTNGWGIKAKNSDGTDAATYTAITTNPQVFFTGGPHDESTWTNFEIGVTVSSKIPQGTYQTDVTVLAAVKN